MSLKAFLAGVAVALVLVGGLAGAYFLGDSRQPNTSQQSAQLAPSPVPTATTGPVSCGLEQVNRAAKGTVRLETYEATGSGFLISDDVVVTNEHVIEGYTRVNVQFADSSRSSGTVVAISDSLDLALVRLQSKKAGLALNWGDSDALKGAQSVVAIGFPLGATGLPVFTKGSVSRVGTDADGYDLVQTDASINPGNSGGPLVDDCGRVMGIVTWKRRNAVGIGYAQATSQVQPEVERLMGSTTVLPRSGGSGSSSRPFSSGPAFPVSTATPVRAEQEQAVFQYYSYIGTKDFVRAFGLLSTGFKGGASFTSWQQGYATTQSVRVNSLALLPGSSNQVGISFSATDLKNGALVTNDFTGTWSLVRETDGWKLDRGVISAAH